MTYRCTNEYSTSAAKLINTGSFTYNTSFAYLAGANGSQTTRIGTITNNGSDITYTYDNNGNITAITQDGQVISYAYNELSELIREDNQVLNKTITYSYDAGGNILNKAEYPYTTGTLGTPTATIAYSYGDNNWKDKLTSYDGRAITYDSIGNPLTYDGWTFSWEQGRQLAGMTGNSQSISFKYNDDGIRTAKTVNGVTTTYHLLGDRVTFESNGTDSTYYTYDAAGDLISLNLNGTEYYCIRNAQGDITGLFNSAGTQVVAYTYDSWASWSARPAAWQLRLALRIPIAIEAIATIPRQGGTTSTAGIIILSGGGLLMPIQVISLMS